MASTLNDTHGIDRVTGKGHGTAALGPSDSTDSGSDITGAAGADIGDADLDSDSDSVGTGEHMTAGRDPQAPANSDILPDHIEVVPDAALEEEKRGR